MLLKVYHAYWFGKNTDCVALKIYINEYFNQELFVLNFLNGVNVHERNHIIKMLGYGKNDEKFFLAIELEEDNLRNYYGKIHRGKRKERSNVKVLNKIIKGAAKALAQFHKFGGHGDVKQENFVVSRDQDSNADVINVKLIDFNLSVLYGHDHDVNGIQKYDIKDFGNMVYRLLNDHYNKGLILS
uniref:Protein kinase domain-containing protein n=1 Tax=Meloidogyne enterolobii TaxID=390850 RepID=A0A6V7Y351_MELEN|nr:unnamed protein product [Meloidogyne enterolobii]